MPEFSVAGIRDLPRTTADTLAKGDPRVLEWLQEAIEEGDRINRADPSYDVIERSQLYLVGEQLSPERQRLKYLPQVVINETRKAVQAHVSALTDLKPVFGWRPTNPDLFQRQADLLNRLAIAEWVMTMADIELGECVKYALTCGTGDLVVDWDPHAPFGGANSYSARDPRDTLPIRPSQGRSVQLWQGVVLREEHSVNALRGMYPTKADLFRPASDNQLGRVMGKFRTMAARLITPADPLDSLNQKGTHTRKSRSGQIVLYRAYLRDSTRNLTDRGIVMGTPGSAWQYVANPGEPLYPRGRLIVATDDATIYDGPNTYWHGRYPVCRLRLWSVPWQLLGIPLLNDLCPTQDAINDTVNDIRLALMQWLDPDVVFNKNAVSETTMRVSDTRRPGKRLKTNPSFGEPYKKLDGPNPQIIAQAVEFWQQLTQKFADMSGTANLSALMQLRQMPSADTIQKYYEALTPEIRYEARQVEAFMRDLAELIKPNYFQFRTTKQFIAILGESAATLADVDYDPDTLVPAVKPHMPGYTPELDPDLTTRDQRAQYFHNQFIFTVAPNSILAINGADRRMIAMQEVRSGLRDFWSYHETMETPNVGAPPAIPLPPLEPITPEVQAALVQQLMLNAQGGLVNAPLQAPDGKAYTFDPASGQLLELRVPQTVTERLVAQNLMGIGQVANAAGRKASGQESPRMESKGDEPGGRTTVTESRK